MVTEILGLLIIAGALLVLLVRYITRRQQRPMEEQQEMQQSTVRLKEELERSGDAIVERLRSHVTHLEELIREADAKNALLDAKLSECRRLEAEIGQKADELQLLMEQARAREQQLAARTGPVRVDARDFASVLQNSIERDPVPVQAPPAAQPILAAPPADSRPAKARDTVPSLPKEPAREPSLAHSAQQAESLAEAMTHRQPEADVPEEEEESMQPGEPNPGTAAAKARALLLSGYSIEEVAKDTGLGKRAVELIQQMHRSL